MAVEWKNRCRWDTGFSADSVEWCPVEPYRNVLVCGTYQLDTKSQGEETKKQSRLGRIYLFVINKDLEDLTPVQTIDTSGILDQKWCYHTIGGFPVLATVTSDGFVELYRLIDEGFLTLKLWVKEEIGKDLLALSIDWSTNKRLNDKPKLVVSDSSGSVTVMTVEDEGLKKIGSWKSHDFEAWIAAFNYWNTDVFYSGGDDCVFKSYDIRVPEVAVTTNRIHGAGVTSVRSHTDEEHQLLTGSYDEIIRVWDTRQLKRSVSETNVNGGVWRLKWQPSRPHVLLAACMYGGFRVLMTKEDQLMGQFNVVVDYRGHDSIAYGADWKWDDDIVATCSFYDCQMHINEVVFN